MDFWNRLYILFIWFVMVLLPVATKMSTVVPTILAFTALIFVLVFWVLNFNPLVSREQLIDRADLSTDVSFFAWAIAAIWFVEGLMFWFVLIALLAATIGLVVNFTLYWKKWVVNIVKTEG